MRKLSDSFMDCLQHGFLAGLTERVRRDKDLDLEIRNNSLNVYYKGNSLLKLVEPRPGLYRPTVDAKFLDGIALPDFMDEATVACFLDAIPAIKENIIRVARTSLETEYEQLIIRANNREMRNSSEYFVVDRQYRSTGSWDRFGLTGCHWQNDGGRRGQTLAPPTLEVKFALISDAGRAHVMLER